MVPIKSKDIPDILLSHIGTIYDLKFPKQGCTSDVGIVNGQNGQFVLKRTKTKQFNEWLSNEAKILKNLSKLKLPIPKVYDYIEVKVDKNKLESWLLMSYIKGNTIREEIGKSNSDKYEIIYYFGKTLAMIHNMKCSADLIDKDQDWILKKLEQAEYNLMNYTVDGNFELLQKLKKNIPNQIENTLIHGDYTIDNVMIHEGKIVGIIDWSDGVYGDPRYDIALAIRPKPYIFQTKKDYEVFFDGYGKYRISDEEYNYFAEGLYEFF